MVKIRLSRGGSKKRPFYHIVATDSRSSRDGKYIERLGFYNPSANKNEEDIRIDLERFSYWKSVGAQVSDRVKKLAKLTDLSREERDLQILGVSAITNHCATEENPVRSNHVANAGEILNEKGYLTNLIFETMLRN